MLEHLADVVETGVAQEYGDTYRTDALDALLVARDVVEQHRSNMEHVRAIYDAKVVGGPGIE